MKVIVPYLTTTTTDHDERYCVLIRFCKYSANAREQVDRMPKEFFLVIDKTQFKVQHKYTYAPFDITSLVMSNCEQESNKQSLAFRITLDSNNSSQANQADTTGFYYGVFLMKKLDHKMALANFMAKSPLDRNVSLDIVKQTLSSDEIEIVDDSKQRQIKMSLLCPISSTKIKQPARSVNCEHVHCFDAESFITINATTARWKCPVCMIFIKMDDLIIDSLIANILRDAPTEVTNAIIFEDGRFEYIQDAQQNTTNLAVANSSLPISNQPPGKRKIEAETAKKVKVQSEIKWITIDEDDDEDAMGENNSDIEIVFEKIVPRIECIARLATAD